MNFSNCAGAINNTHIAILFMPQATVEFINSEACFFFVLQGIINHCARLHLPTDAQYQGNWRPIALCSTVTKLYAICLVAHITEWAVIGRTITWSQKGYMSMGGCYKHNFTLQVALDNAWRTRKQCTVAWLDISNAFSSVPHCHIVSTLCDLGLLDGIVDLV
ncbi:hypothetical protein Y1Q_0017971 [Alligator mississippiensis]|uniref:Reverse transcriptase domain-containing protein n=1 Tax=Alligator mississippiensis TaxID=8496 RepID=A0A151MXU8_ALLMI|nr:hypothetical protein Y1Q_0017971 [Alligator mississippiensis]